MKKRFSFNPAITRMAVLVLFPFITIACGASMKLATITFHDNELREILQKVSNITSTEGWDFVIQDAEIEDGYIRVTGDYSPSEAGMVSGSIDIDLTVEDGSLSGMVDRVNIPGYAAPDRALKIVCDQVVQQITSRASEGKQEVKYESVEVKEGIIKIILRYLP